MKLDTIASRTDSISIIVRELSLLKRDMQRWWQNPNKVKWYKQAKYEKMNNQSIDMSVRKLMRELILIILGYHHQSSCSQNVSGNYHKSVPSNVMDQSRVASLPIYITIPNPSHDNQFPSSSHDETHDKTHTQMIYPILISES